jgi:hypothetical protein
MQEMIDAGAPMPAIVVAVRALEAEQDKLAAKREQAAERKRRQRERDSHVTVTGQSQDKPLSLDKEIPPRPPKEINPNPGSDTRPRKADPFSVCPDGCDPRHWQDFQANRKTKRLAKTETAYLGVLRDLQKWADAEWPPGRILQFAVERGWGAIFDPRKSLNGSNHVRTSGFQQSGAASTDRTIAAAIEVFGHPDDPAYQATRGHA